MKTFQYLLIATSALLAVAAPTQPDDCEPTVAPAHGSGSSGALSGAAGHAVAQPQHSAAPAFQPAVAAPAQVEQPAQQPHGGDDDNDDDTPKPEHSTSGPPAAGHAAPPSDAKVNACGNGRSISCCNGQDNGSLANVLGGACDLGDNCKDNEIYCCQTEQNGLINIGLSCVPITLHLISDIL